MPTTHEFLRDWTAGLHEKVDEAFGRFDIGSEAGYRALLSAHAQAVLPLEAKLDRWEHTLPSWSGRKRGDALLADLADLGIDPGDIDTTSVLPIDSEEAAWGVAYVLEGSRLGGRFLARNLAAAAPRRYLDAPQPRGSWPKLLRSLNRSVYTTAQRNIALAAATRAFKTFQRAALESVA